MSEKPASAPRCAALIGPYLSGKTTLLESILFATGSIGRKGTVKDGNTVGDSSPEARDRHMSVELSAATTDYLGDRWTFIDCPGSVELTYETLSALQVVDTAVVVCEPAIEKALGMAARFKMLDDLEIPHMVFVNKMDLATQPISDFMDALQATSDRPLVLRQVPMRNGEAVRGYVDLVSERAYEYREGEPSKLIEIPSEVEAEHSQARQELLESLADFDDTLLEQLLEDVLPPRDEVYQHLTSNLQADRIVPVFLGAAEHQSGVARLLKALRHETPSHEATAARLGLEIGGGTLATVCKTYYAPHTGKLNLARVWSGSVKDGDTLNGHRVSGVFRMSGSHQDKAGAVEPGDVVALGRMEEVRTGDVLTDGGDGENRAPENPMPVYAFAITAENRSDEVKLSESIAKLIEEDPSLQVEHNHDTNEMVLWGQGEMHLQISLARLNSKYNLAINSRRPQVPYKETIAKSVAQHARHKKQSGGHGQFGDVQVEIKPLPRGTGFEFIDKITGGAVPRQYIPSVENGIKEYLSQGPLGFNVVDLSVTLVDGKHHAVDSSDMAFKTAGRLAMAEGLPKCAPVLLEPIVEVTVSAPGEFTANMQRVITGRRGQILGFNAKEGWTGWDEVKAFIPQAEMHDMIVEIRSLTQGIGSFVWKFDHLQELSGREADQVVEARAQALAEA